MARVELSPALMKFTHGQGSVDVSATSLAGVIEELEGRFPGIKSKLFTEGGKQQRYVSIFVGSEDARYLEGLETSVSKSDQVSILLALAGG